MKLFVFWQHCCISIRFGSFFLVIIIQLFRFGVLWGICDFTTSNFAVHSTELHVSMFHCCTLVLLQSQPRYTSNIDKRRVERLYIISDFIKSWSLMWVLTKRTVHNFFNCVGAIWGSEEWRILKSISFEKLLNEVMLEDPYNKMYLVSDQ